MIMSLNTNKIEVGTLKAKGEIFIVPNSLCRVKNFWLDSVKNYVINAARVNGIDPTEELFVQTWIVSEDLGTDNLGDHGGKHDHYYVGIDTSYLPVSLFKDKKEGDQVSVNFDAYWQNRYMDQSVSIPLQMNLQLSQTKYRYSNFGSFEDCLERLLEYAGR